MRFDRIIPLSELAFHPSNDYADLVFFIPRNEKHLALRVWLKTACENPMVRIDDHQFVPCGVQESNGHRWLDMGKTDKLAGFFGQLRIESMSYREAMDSWLVITKSVQHVFCDSIDCAYESLFGISPSKIGHTTLHPGTVRAGASTIFTMTYRTGRDGLPKNSILRTAIPHAVSTPQIDDPKSDGYISAISSNPSETMTAIRCELSEESHVAHDVWFQMNEGLKSNSIVTVTFRSDLTPIFNAHYPYRRRKYWYVRQAPLNIGVRIPGYDAEVEPMRYAGHDVTFSAGPPERLFLFLPGRIQTHEQVTLRGTYTDRFRNTPPDGYANMNLSFVLLRDGIEKPIDVPMTNDTFYSFRIKLGRLSPGLYRIKAVDEYGLVLCVSNPMCVMEKNDRRLPIRFGEIHGHCEMSDGSGGYEQMYLHARDVGCLDFAASADHACYFSDNEWEMMQSITNSMNEPGAFVTLVGYEWAGRQVHRNIYSARDHLKLFRGMYAPTSELSVVYDAFEQDEKVVGGPHAPIAHGIRFEHHNPSVERFVEMYSMWGANDFADSPLLNPRGHHPPRTMTVNEILERGAILGFTGGGDCHEGRCGFSCEDQERQGIRPHTFAKELPYRCGLTGAHMETLDRDALIEALRERQTYATTGARILLDFWVNDHPMGAVAPISDRLRVYAKISGCSLISEVRLIQNGQVVASQSYDEEDVDFTWETAWSNSTPCYMYIQVIQDDGHMAWSSPVFLNEVEK